ncbi:MAG: four helix bundle protein [Nostoc sp.]|uniref:four helix bundle protein n=1 Tax=Nostoc sp. TaxID=1180 RepID=UPI002FF2D9F1
MKIESHRDLIVWQKSMDMVVQIYQLTAKFPATETYRLTSQITRAAVSVPANMGASSFGRFIIYGKM